MTIFTAKSLARVLLWSSLSLAASGCQQEESTSAPDSEHFPKVSSQRLIRSTNYDTEQVFTGSIRAGNTTDIGFELAGKIDRKSVV